MAFWKKKRIGKNSYWYFSKSIRLPDGKVKKIEKRAEKTVPEKQLFEWAAEQEKKLLAEWASKHYHANLIFSPEEFAKTEAIRADYKKLLQKMTRNQLKDLFDRFTVNFTYESNALEGNSLTLKDVAIVLFEKTVIKGKELREIYETINSRKVIELVLKKKFDVSEKDCIRMHKQLVENMNVATGYKTIPNFLVERNVETTPPEKVKQEMDALFRFYEENKGKLHPIELAAAFHAKFEKIHPFEDGNGRVGRFLINVILLNSGYPPLIIRKTQRIAYFKCLEDADHGYSDNLKRFLLEKYKETYRKFFEIYIKYLPEKKPKIV
ncbi:MAG: Fic family protein [Candidatus Micrarchaeota archaeon]